MKGAGSVRAIRAAAPLLTCAQSASSVAVWGSPLQWTPSAATAAPRAVPIRCRSVFQTTTVRLIDISSEWGSPSLGIRKKPACPPRETDSSTHSSLPAAFLTLALGIIMILIAAGDGRDAERNVAQIVNCRCVLAVRDLRVSTRYYVEVLGFCKDPIDAEGWSFLMLGECHTAPVTSFPMCIFNSS